MSSITEAQAVYDVAYADIQKEDVKVNHYTEIGDGNATAGHNPLYESVREPEDAVYQICLLYTSPSPRDRQKSRMPSSA